LATTPSRLGRHTVPPAPLHRLALAAGWGDTGGMPRSSWQDAGPDAALRRRRAGV